MIKAHSFLGPAGAHYRSAFQSKPEAYLPEMSAIAQRISNEELANLMEIVSTMKLSYYWRSQASRRCSRSTLYFTTFAYFVCIS
jgi:hypothetical protein